MRISDWRSDVCSSDLAGLTKRWWEGGCVYQIYPRSFQDSDGDGVGDLSGIAWRLDHLVDLGVDAVWLSPVYPSPMADFGYDVADYRDIDPMFGTLRSEEHTSELQSLMRNSYAV